MPVPLIIIQSNTCISFKRYRFFFLAVAVPEAAAGEGNFLVVVPGFPTLVFPTTTTLPLTPTREVPEAPVLLGLPMLPFPAPDAGLDAPPWLLPEAATSASFRAFLYVPGDS